jgi:hypothetical protein
LLKGLITRRKKWRDPNGIRTHFFKFPGVAQFPHKYALDCALEAKTQIVLFARIAQNYAVSVSEIVRKRILSIRARFFGSDRSGLLSRCIFHGNTNIAIRLNSQINNASVAMPPLGTRGNLTTEAAVAIRQSNGIR